MPASLTRVITRSPEETKALGQEVARKLTPPKLIGLVGPLGSGKTVFVKGFAEGMGVKERVTSPTFVLFNRHPAARGFFLNHIDLYRLEGREDLAQLGLEEWWGEENVTLIEWADRLKTLPKERVTITFAIVNDNEREVALPAEWVPASQQW